MIVLQERLFMSFRTNTLERDMDGFLASHIVTVVAIRRVVRRAFLQATPLTTHIRMLASRMSCKINLSDGQ